MNEAGMACVGKHFPGHGSISEDSHIEKPIDQRTLNEIENKDLKKVFHKFLQCKDWETW